MKQIRLVFPTHQSEFSTWVTAAKTAGAHILHYPTLATSPLDDAQHLARDLQNHDAQTRILLASPAAAEAALGALAEPALAARDSGKAPLRLLALGYATADSAQELIKQLSLSQTNPVSIEVELAHGITDTSDLGADSTLTRLADLIPPGVTLLVPVAVHTHEPLLGELRRAGFQPLSIPAYVRRMANGGDPVGNLLFQGSVDAVFFPTPEHLRFFRRRLLTEGGVLSMLDHVRVLCLDAWTAAVARQLGLRVDAVVAQSNVPLQPEQLTALLQDRAS